MDSGPFSEEPSTLWIGITVLRGLYALWYLRTLFSLFLTNTDFDDSTETNDDTKQNYPEPPTEDSPHIMDSPPPTNDSTENSSPTDDSEEYSPPAPYSPPIPDSTTDETVTDGTFGDVGLEDDVKFVVGDLIERVAIAVDNNQGGAPPVVSSGDGIDDDATGHGDTFSRTVTEAQKFDKEAVAGPSSPDTSEESYSMDSIRRKFLSGPPAKVGEASSAEVEKKKTNFFRRALKRCKKPFVRKKKDQLPAPEQGTSTEDQQPSSGSSVQRTLSEINRMWLYEPPVAPRRRPMVHFSNRVQVTTFLVKKPMSRYDDTAPSEVSQEQRLKREGDFEEVGLLRTRNSFRHRLQRGATRVGRLFQRKQ